MEFPKIMVVAHRGASGLVEHENTIEAFQKAIEVNADCIETDIRKTSDGVIVVFHDSSIDQKPIKSLTYKQLLEISVSKGFKVPTLEETLDFVKGKILIDIEFKEGGYEEEAVALIHKHMENSEFYIRSFYDEILVKIKRIDSGIITALLLGFDRPKRVFLTRLSELFPRRRIKRTHCDYVSPYYRLLKFGYVRRMKWLKKPVSVWTVNDEEIMRYVLLKKKVTSIVTNYPDLAIRILQDANLRK